jgi:hypothetical protein
VNDRFEVQAGLLANDTKEHRRNPADGRRDRIERCLKPAFASKRILRVHEIAKNDLLRPRTDKGLREAPDPYAGSAARPALVANGLYRGNLVRANPDAVSERDEFVGLDAHVE